MHITPVEMTIAVCALLLAGLAKGITGMGLPVIAVPILTVLFDLKTAIAVTILTTLVTDLVMLLSLPKNWKKMKKASALMIFGVCGSVIGSFLLVMVNQLILSGVLGVVIIIFVVTSFFSLLPTFSRRTLLDVVVGLVGGGVQGAAGASGPIISMYLLQMKMNRNEFLFMINSFFVLLDLTQVITIYRLGVYHGILELYTVLAIIPAILALAIAFVLQKRISDRLFKNSVLAIMTLSGILLLYKSVNFIL